VPAFMRWMTHMSDRASGAPRGLAPHGNTLRDLGGGWLSAVGGRVAYLTHTLAGHVVEWRRSSPGADCAGDIVCDDCEQVLWCRAHDPWNAKGRRGVADHWGATCQRTPRRPLLEVLDHILRLADRCPRDRSGDDVRRMSCRLIEAGSTRERRLIRRRLLAALSRLEGVPPATLEQRQAAQRLTDILRSELPHATPAGARPE
jgi:hypothetical protein